MFAAIRNTPLPYVWGSDEAISRLLGTEGACQPGAAGAPEAELWFGAHHGSPSAIDDPRVPAADLAEWIRHDPTTVLGPFANGLREGDGSRLPFLLKVLAAGAPLSLQAHPTLDDARAGFAAESAAGLALDAPTRNYRDPSHKPELLLAVSPTMEALAGFRAVEEMRAVVAGFAQAAHRAADASGTAALDEFTARLDRACDGGSLRDVVGWALGGGQTPAAATAAVVRLADASIGHDDELLRRAGETVRLLNAHHGVDPGILIALLLQRLTLRRGEAIFVGAGVLHAYLAGIGVEIMAASDNVLRGGLTPKHVDVAELQRVVDTTSGAEMRWSPEVRGRRATFHVPVPDFRLDHVRPGVEDAVRVPVSGPAIVLVLGGVAGVRGDLESRVLERGSAVFVTADERELEISGDAELVVAQVGVDAASDAPVGA